MLVNERLPRGLALAFWILVGLIDSLATVCFDLRAQKKSICLLTDALWLMKLEWPISQPA